MALSRGSKIFLVGIVVVAGVVGGGLWYVNDQLSGVPGEGDPVELEVEQGATAAAIGERLEDEDVIKNALAFRLMARSQSVSSNLKAGRFTFETGMSVDEAIDVLLAGPAEPEPIRVTVAEGLAIPPTLDKLASQTDYTVDDLRSILDARIESGPDGEDVLSVPDWVPDLSGFSTEVRHPFEGLLFPETYFFEPDVAAQRILQRMIDELDARMAEIPEEQIQAAEQAGIDRYKAAVLASLIERETRVDDERDRVAGVIYNRLEQGMPLQIDATVLYALGKWQERVLTEDTDVQSPYNTYQTAGLPPTPISGFGEASLRAAFAPADVPFLYYVLSPECDGTHQFAETLEQHNRNKQEYIEAGRCQQE